MENENGGRKNVKTRWAGLSRSLRHTPSLTSFWLIFPKGKVSCLGFALTGSSPRRTLTRGRRTPLASQKSRKGTSGIPLENLCRESSHDAARDPSKISFYQWPLHPARPTAYGAARLASLCQFRRVLRLYEAALTHGGVVTRGSRRPKLFYSAGNCFITKEILYIDK